MEAHSKWTDVPESAHVVIPRRLHETRVGGQRETEGRFTEKFAVLSIIVTCKGKYERITIHTYILHYPRKNKAVSSGGMDA